MGDMQVFLQDQPYGFVPLLEHCTQTEGSSHQIIEKNTYHGKLKLKITVKTPLYIGGKQQECDSNSYITKKQIRRNGNIIIPGSSLKGAVRTIAEAVSYSCAVKMPQSRKFRDILPKNNKNSCFRRMELCPTCSIFGMIGNRESYKGKVSFGEFVLKSGTCKKINFPKLESPFTNYPKPHDVFTNPDENYGNERLYYCKACDTGSCLNCTKEDYFNSIQAAGRERKMEFRGRKFYYTNENLETIKEKDKEVCLEMLKAGSILEGEIIVQNLRKEEGQLLAYALDIGQYFVMKLGYGKPLGYGQVTIELEGVENMGSHYLTGTIAGNTLKKEDVETWGNAYRENSPSDIKDAIKKLEQIMGKGGKT